MEHPDFLQIVNYAHELGFVLSIATNGTRISQEIVDLLPREECIVSVSLDGIEFHKEMRRRTSFDETVAKLMLLKEQWNTFRRNDNSWHPS